MRDILLETSLYIKSLVQTSPSFIVSLRLTMSYRKSTCHFGSRFIKRSKHSFLSYIAASPLAQKQLLLTKGDNNYADDIELYQGLDWLEKRHIVGKVRG